MSVFSKFLQLQNGAARTVDLASNTLATLAQQLNGSSSGHITLNAAASTASYSIFFPAAQGGASSFLQNDGSGNLSWSSLLSSPSISNNFIAGETFSANTSYVVRWAMNSLSETSDEVFKADFDATSNDDFWAIGIAFSPTAVTAGQSITVYSFGAYTLGSGDTNFSSADIGKPIWLTSNGAFDVVAPTGTNEADFKVGIVMSATQIWLDGQMMAIGNTSGGGVTAFPLPIAEGGTGQTTAAAAFAALSPLTTAGDLVFENATPAPDRLPIGSSGQVLTVSSGLPTWVDPSVSPGAIALAQNHILVGNASNLAADVAMSGEASIVASGAVTLSNAAVIAKLLTAYSASAGTVSSSDSILSAIQKIDGNDALKLPLAGGTMSGAINMGSHKITGLTSGSATGEALQYGQIGAANGIAGLDGSGKVPFAQLPSALMSFLGAWDASSNTPTLADGTGDPGDTYRVSVAGTQNLGSGSQSYFVGDFVIYNGTIWQRSPAADGVISVNGASGAVTVNAINQLTGDVTAGPASGSASAAATIANLAVTNAKIANSTIDLTTKVTGVLPSANVGLGRTINAQTGTTYTFVLGDGSAAGGNPLVTASNASAQTYTVPPNSSVAFPVGTQIDILQLGTGKVTLAQGSGVTINSKAGNKAISAQYVGVSLIKTDTDVWSLLGDLIA